MRAAVEDAMDTRPIEIDGSLGEGGGQILRSSLALSLVTGRPFRAIRIRAGRSKPGLLRQHLTALEAATAIGAADVQGGQLGSQELSFAPTTIRSGDYGFAVGSAGSATLVLQTVLPALMLADGPSSLVVEGGTHNPFAPPFDFLERSFLGVLRQMGPNVRATLERPGFYPAGGGRFRVDIEPVSRLSRIDLLERGELIERRAVARVSNLSPKIAKRELALLAGGLSWSEDAFTVEPVRDAVGPGNVVTVELTSEHVVEVFTGFGRRGASAETVARELVREVREYLVAGVPVGPYLADQLLLPFALAGGGSFRTTRPTRHTHTNAEIIARFVDVDVAIEREDRTVWRVDVRAQAPEQRATRQDESQAGEKR